MNQALIGTTRNATYLLEILYLNIGIITYIGYKEWHRFSWVVNLGIKMKVIIIITE